MKKALLPLLFQVIVFNLLAQPTLNWEFTYGGTGTENIGFSDQTADGGYIMAGSSNSPLGSDNDAFIVKTDANGGLEWTQSYGSTGDDFALAIRQKADGGYICVAVSTTQNGDVGGPINGAPFAIWVFTMDANGGLDGQINNTYGGSGFQLVFDIRETADGGFIFCGQTTSGETPNFHGGNDVYITKLDGVGNIVWERAYGGNDSDTGYSIIETSDGNYLAACSTSSSANGDVTGTGNGGNDIWALKLDQDGNIIWEENFGSLSEEVAYSVVELSDGYAFSSNSGGSGGDVSGNNGGTDFWVIKVSTDGQTLMWEQNYGGIDNEEITATGERLVSLAVTSDDDLLVVGTTESGQSGDVSNAQLGSGDVWILEVDGATGDLIWEKNFGGSQSEFSYTVFEDNDGNVVMAGKTSSSDGDVSQHNSPGLNDFWLINLSPPAEANTCGIVSNLEITNTTCGQINGTAQVNPAGGTGGPYTVTWSGGESGRV